MLVWNTTEEPPVWSIDPYGEWACRHGRDFLINYRYRPPPDVPFPYWYAVLTPDRSGFVLRSEEQLVTGRTSGSDDPVQSLGQNELVIPLGIPPEARGCCSGDLCDAPADWTAPEGFAAGRRPAILGVIDDAMALTHPRLRAANGGSRVDYAWIQEAKAGPDVPFGREMLRSDIDRAIRSGVSPEGAFRALGLVAAEMAPQQMNLLSQAAHGTMALDLAAGRQADPEAVDCRVIAVQLPSLANWDRAGAGLAYFVLAGLEYVFCRAEAILAAIGAPCPVIVNLSYGVTGGARHGGHALQHFIDARVAAFKEGHPDVPVAVVLPAGNGFLDRSHAVSPAVGPGETAALELDWRVSGGDRSSSFVEIWLPAGEEPTAVEVVVTPPAGPEIVWARPPRIAQASVAAITLHDTPDGSCGLSNCIARLSYDQPNFSTDRRRVMLAIAPTETSCFDARRPPAPAGLWKVHARAKLPLGGRLRAFVQREATTPGYPPRGAPSYFDDPEYHRFEATGEWSEQDDPDCCVQRYGTLSGAVPGAHAVSIGSYRLHDRRCSRYSAASLPDADPLPDALAPADHSGALPGIPVATNRGGNAVRFTGTSAAAAFASRVLARADPPGDMPGDWARATLGAAASAHDEQIARERPMLPPLPPRPSPVEKIPVARGGAGRLPPQPGQLSVARTDADVQRLAPDPP